MNQPKTFVYLCDHDWKRIAPLQCQNLQYSQGINCVDQAYWEMQIQNPVFKDLGFDFLAKDYYVEVLEDTTVRFRGEIDEMPLPDTKQSANDSLQTMDRIAFRASHKIDQFRHTLVTPNADDKFYIRTFDDVSFGTAVQTVVEEAIARGDNSLVKDVTIGTIENPYDQNGNELKFVTAQEMAGYNVLDFIDSTAYYANADYWLGNDNVFNLVRNKGILREDKIFRLHFGEDGNNLQSARIVYSKRDLTNKVVIIGAGTGTELKIAESSDASHQSVYGIREIALPARNLDTYDTAMAYSQSKLDELKTPGKLVVFTPTQTHEPLWGFDLGDVITVDIDWFIFKFIKRMRVMGVTTFVNQEGSRFFSYSLEEPKTVRLTPAGV